VVGVVVAVEGGGRRPPGRLPRGELLVEERGTVAVGDAERAVLGLVPAHGGKDDEAALGEKIERRETLREEQWMAERRDDRGRREPQRRGARVSAAPGSRSVVVTEAIAESRTRELGHGIAGSWLPGSA